MIIVQIIQMEYGITKHTPVLHKLSNIPKKVLFQPRLSTLLGADRWWRQPEPGSMPIATWQACQPCEIVNDVICQPLSPLTPVSFSCPAAKVSKAVLSKLQHSYSTTVLLHTTVQRCSCLSFFSPSLALMNN